MKIDKLLATPINADIEHALEVDIKDTDFA